MVRQPAELAWPVSTDVYGSYVDFTQREVDDECRPFIGPRARCIRQCR